LVRLTFARPQVFGMAVAAVALALAACGHSGGGSTPTTVATATPTPGPTGSVAPGCLYQSSGIAYLSDGGNGGSFRGLQVVHFENSGAVLCNSPLVTYVPFSGPLGPFYIGSSGDVAVGAYALSDGGPITQIQDVFGASLGNLIPVGSAYDVTSIPTPRPSITPTAVPSFPPVLSDVGGVAIVGAGTSAVALVAGAGNGLLGVTSLALAPPQFGGYAPYVGGSPDPGLGNRTSVVVAADDPPTSVLLRGPNDILGYHVTLVQSGYQFKLVSYATNLGYGNGLFLRGTGGMAINPADATHGVMIKAPKPNDVVLLTSLPSAFNIGAVVTLPSVPHSVAIATGGQVAVVGADNGFYVFKGVNGGTLGYVHPFAPNPNDARANAPKFRACDGHLYRMTNVSSIGFSQDQRYIIVVGTPPGPNCAGGRDASLIALPFNTATGGQPSPSPKPSPTATPAPGSSPVPTPTPVPTMYTVNGLINPPVDTDYLIVR
jgi:hypothetical protein